jgi:hypothetical protein
MFEKVVQPVIFSYWKAMQAVYLASCTSALRLTGDGQVYIFKTIKKRSTVEEGAIVN